MWLSPKTNKNPKNNKLNIAKKTLGSFEHLKCVENPNNSLFLAETS